MDEGRPCPGTHAAGLGLGGAEAAGSGAAGARALVPHSEPGPAAAGAAPLSPAAAGLGASPAEGYAPLSPTAEAQLPPFRGRGFAALLFAWPGMSPFGSTGPRCANLHVMPLRHLPIAKNCGTTDEYPA